MLAIVGALALVFCLILRPMEIVPALAPLRLLDVCTVTITLGVIVELFTRRERSLWSPQIPWLGAFAVWCFLVTAVRLGLADAAKSTWSSIGLAAIFMLLIGSSARSFPKFRAIATMMVVCLAVVSVIGVDQGMTESQCLELVPDELGNSDLEDAIPDGRPCESAFLCTKGGKENVEYACERLGKLGSISVERRVRWRGQLSDPNELSVFIGAVLPLVFAFAASTQSKKKKLLALALVGVALWAVVLTASRGGQLVIATVFLVYFVRRFGWKGAVLAGVLTLPILLLGGREGAAAEASSLERATILYEGVDLVRAHPFIGVGINQFAEEISIHYTAHNSYLLATAELGFAGGVLWCGLMWMSVKIPLTISRNPPEGLDPAVIPFATALAVSFAAMGVGVFFLSFCYKQILFLYVGMSGALYGLVKKQCPSFDVKTTRRDVIGVAIFVVLIMAVIFVGSRLTAT